MLLEQAAHKELLGQQEQRERLEQPESLVPKAPQVRQGQRDKLV